jgi:hypothetical protein
MLDKMNDQTDPLMQSLQDELSRISAELMEYDVLRERQSKVKAALAALTGGRAAAPNGKRPSSGSSVSAMLFKVLSAAGAEGMTVSEIRAALEQEGATFKPAYVSQELTRRSKKGEVSRNAETGRWMLVA